MTIGERIHEARKKAGLTQTELAKKIGVMHSAIHKYETGIITNIPIDRIRSIASALNVTPAYLMGWEDDTTISALEIDYYGNLGNGTERDDMLRMLFHMGYKATPNILSFREDGIKTWTITDENTKIKYIVPAEELEKLNNEITSFSKKQIIELLDTWGEKNNPI